MWLRKALCILLCLAGLANAGTKVVWEPLENVSGYQIQHGVTTTNVGLSTEWIVPSGETLGESIQVKAYNELKQPISSSNFLALSEPPEPATDVAVSWRRVMALPASDTFTGEEDPLAGNWSQAKGASDSLKKTSGYAVGRSGSDNVSYWNADSFGADQYSEVVFSAIGDSGPMVRSITSGTSSSYYFCAIKPTYFRVYRNVGGSYTQIGSDVTRTNSTTETFRLTASGTTISVSVDGTTLFSETDSSISGGSAGSTAAGISMWSTAGGQITSWTGGNVGGGGANLIQGTTKGIIKFAGYSPQDSFSARSRLVQGSTSGNLKFTGLSIRDERSLRTRLIQKLDTGILNLTGLSPVNIYTSNLTVVNLIEGLVGGRLNTIGLGPVDKARAVQAYFEGITTGRNNFLGLSPQDQKKASAALFEVLTSGLFTFSGASPQDGPTGILVRGKSAASRLGLGNYSNSDVWTTPLTTYVEKLRETKNTPSDERKGAKSALLEETLTLITQEIKRAEKSLLQNSLLNQSSMKKDIDRRLKIKKIVEQRLAMIHHQRLLQDDEELLLLLL